MSEDNRPQIPKIDETKPVVWTAEDASRFLTSAIHEAQKPLAEALKQRPITSRALTMIVAVLIVAALAIALILSSQLEKTEKRAEAALSAREEILSEKVNLQAQTSTLQDRLSALTDQQGDFQKQIDNLRLNEEKHKRTQVDLSRFRRQNELLRSQISGLEMEKVALARQLEAVKALAEADPEAEPADETTGPFDSSDPATQNGAGSQTATPAATDAEAPEDTTAAPAAPAAEAGSPVAEDSQQTSTANAIPFSMTQPASDAIEKAEEQEKDEAPADAEVISDNIVATQPEDDASSETAVSAPASETREEFRKDPPFASDGMEERFEPSFVAKQTEDAEPTSVAEDNGEESTSGAVPSGTPEEAEPVSETEVGMEEQPSVTEASEEEVLPTSQTSQSESAILTGLIRTETASSDENAVQTEPEAPAAETTAAQEETEDGANEEPTPESVEAAEEATNDEAGVSDAPPVASADTDASAEISGEENSNAAGEYVTLDPEAEVPSTHAGEAETTEETATEQ